MNMMTRVPVQPRTEEDPLDALFDTMFQPMNANGVYARTGAYESVVEAMAALIPRSARPTRRSSGSRR